VDQHKFFDVDCAAFLGAHRSATDRTECDSLYCETENPSVISTYGFPSVVLV
jgi:hypothetical protein